MEVGLPCRHEENRFCYRPPSFIYNTLKPDAYLLPWQQLNVCRAASASNSNVEDDQPDQPRLKLLGNSQRNPWPCWNSKKEAID